MADVYDDMAWCDGFAADGWGAPGLWARLRVSPGKAERLFFGALSSSRHMNRRKRRIHEREFRATHDSTE